MAKLIIGGTSHQKKEKIDQLAKQTKTDLKKNNPDLLIIDPEKSIKIDQIRQIQTFLSKKSWRSGKQKTIIMKNAHLMTPQAQNAFLKTLEEPPANSEIILTTNNKTALIDTIISRCRLINLKTEVNIDIEKNWKKWKEIIKMNKPKRLAENMKFNDRDYQKFIITLQKKLIEDDNQKNLTKCILSLQKARKMLSDNVQPTKVVDWLMLNI